MHRMPGAFFLRGPRWSPASPKVGSRPCPDCVQKRDEAEFEGEEGTGRGMAGEECR